MYNISKLASTTTSGCISRNRMYRKRCICRIRFEKNYIRTMNTVCLKIISIKICRIKESDTNDNQAWHIEKDLQGTVDCLQASDLGVSLTRFCIALQGFTKLAVASERSPNPSPILHYASGLKHRTATSYLAIVCWRTTSRQERCPTRKDRYR